MKRKQKRTSRDPVDRLYKAVQNFVEKNGGKLVIIGGIQIQEWPGDPLYKFHVSVGCLGRKPNKPKEA